jgi:hypothetical protein
LADTPVPPVGQIGSVDLTVPDATDWSATPLRTPERDMPGSGRYCIIEDPAGAVAGLFQAQ